MKIICLMFSWTWCSTVCHALVHEKQTFKKSVSRLGSCSLLHKPRTPPTKRPRPVRCIASHKPRRSVPLRNFFRVLVTPVQDLQGIFPRCSQTRRNRSNRFVPCVDVFSVPSPASPPQAGEHLTQTLPGVTCWCHVVIYQCVCYEAVGPCPTDVTRSLRPTVRRIDVVLGPLRL